MTWSILLVGVFYSSRYLSTTREERREILTNFGNGKYKVIVTSQVLDEGVDVPDASVGLILGGTGSARDTCKG